MVSQLKPNQDRKKKNTKKTNRLLSNTRETESKIVTIQQEKHSELILNHQQLQKSTSKAKTVAETLEDTNANQDYLQTILKHNKYDFINKDQKANHDNQEQSASKKAYITEAKNKQSNYKTEKCQFQHN